MNHCDGTTTEPHPDAARPRARSGGWRLAARTDYCVRMSVLIIGGSGTIGLPIVGALRATGHEVTALARSARSGDRLRRAGCRVISGDLREPQAWLADIDPVEAIIHVGASWGDDMVDAEKALMDGILDHAARHAERNGRRIRLVYTGGCWLYGAVGDQTAVEGSPFDPLPAFAFMVDHRARLFEAPAIDACVVHPALVWDESGGVIGRFLEEAQRGSAPKVIGSLRTRWPLVHRADLAQLYLLAAVRGADGADYHGVDETGVPAGRIAAAIAAKFGAPAPVEQPVSQAVAELGESAAGFALDITMDAPLTRESLGWAPTRPGILDSF